jgi:hypothetical protein
LYYKTLKNKNKMFAISKKSNNSRGLCLAPKKNGKSQCCVKLKNKVIEKPDLAIYSQVEQFALGNIPTWDSPDIVTNYLNPFKLLPEIPVKVRNMSGTASALNGMVHLYISSFGLGMPRQLISSMILNLAPGSETEIKYPLPQDVLNGDQLIGVHVVLQHPHDSNKINNEGHQQFKAVYTSNVGRSFELSFPALNNTAASKNITFHVLSTDLAVVLSTTSHFFSPFEQIQVITNINIPASLHASPDTILRSVTIVSRDAAGQLLDGLTFQIYIDN